MLCLKITFFLRGRPLSFLVDSIISHKNGYVKQNQVCFYFKYLFQRITNTFTISISVIRPRNVKAISFYQSPRRSRRAIRLYLLPCDRELKYI